MMIFGYAKDCAYLKPNGFYIPEYSLQKLGIFIFAPIR